MSEEFPIYLRLGIKTFHFHEKKNELPGGHNRLKSQSWSVILNATLLRLPCA